MTPTPYIIGIILVIHGLKTVSAMRCLRCSNIASPFTCNTVTDCANHEQCFMQQRITRTGQILYNMGCRLIQKCSAGKRRSRSDVITCSHCCHGDYCNMEGCGIVVPKLSQRGPKCFNCSAMAFPNDCTTTEYCGVDQTCGLLEIIKPGGLTWNGRCMPKAQCSAIEMIATGSDCHICCEGDFCNDRCISKTGAITPTTPATRSTTTATTQLILIPTKPTPTHSHVTATWSAWTSWGCSPINDQCFMTRRRSCSTGSGKDCSGTNFDYKLCTNECHTTTKPTTTIPTTTTTTTTTSTTTTAAPTTTTTTAATTTTTGCRDDPSLNCSSNQPDVRALICGDPVIAASKCPMTCGLCDCKDVFSCSSKDARDFFCADDKLAVQFCKRTCGKCAERNIPINLNACFDYYDTAKCELLNNEMCMCKDPVLRQLCSHYCDGNCNGQPVDMSNCAAVTSVIGKRSEILPFFMEIYRR